MNQGLSLRHRPVKDFKDDLGKLEQFCTEGKRLIRLKNSLRISGFCAECQSKD